MAVNLEGYENTPREERQILSIEQFNSYLASTERSYDESILAYIIVELAKKDNLDYEKYYEEYHINSKAEFYKLLEEELGFDIQTVDSKVLIKDVPEEIIAGLEELDSIITNPHSLEEIEEISKKFCNDRTNELYNNKLIQVATEVSKYDLSHIPPELYAQTNFLRYMNFQNTGAKLDFDYINENSNNWWQIYISSENLQGTELISFNPSLYHKLPDGNGYDIAYDLKPENFDISQYQTVITGYNKPDSWINSKLAHFLVNQELQDNNKWLIDVAFEDLNKNYYLARNIWENLTPKTQLENQEKFGKLIEYYKTSGSTYGLGSILSKTQPEIMEQIADELTSLYTGKDGSIDKSYYYQAFQYMSDDFKIKHYEEHKNDYLADRALILSRTTHQYIDSAFKELFNEFLENTDSFSGLYNINNIFLHFIDHEFDDSIMQYILNTLENYVKSDDYQYSNVINNIFRSLNPNSQINYYKDFMQFGFQNKISTEAIAKVFDNMNFEVKKEHFYEILKYAQDSSPEIAHHIRGNGYINMIHSMNRYSPDEKESFIEQNGEEILVSLITKYMNPENAYEDSLSPEERKEFNKNYSTDYVKILMEMDLKGDLNSGNINIIIDNLPKLGKEVINRLYNSNSDMIRANAGQLISTVSSLQKEDAISLIEDTERIFSKNTIPDFVKLYKFYDNVVERDRHVLRSAINAGISNKYSPELHQSGSEKEGKKIIFSDLLNISLKSNNKSLKNFLDILENGNETYIKFLQNDRNLDSLTTEEKEALKKYSDTLYTIYDETAVSRVDKKDSSKKIRNTKDYIKTLDDLSKRYIGNAFPRNLSNAVINTVIGRYDELLAGKRTIADFKNYMEECNQKSNERHAQLEKTKLVLEPGDLIKGVYDATNHLQSLFSDGIRAGEFLGIDNHTDATPLDSDHSLILPRTVRETLAETIQNTTSSTYGSFYLVIKKDSNKIEYTRDDPKYTFKGERAPNYESKLGNNADKEAIKTRMNNRTNGTYKEPKLEAFSSVGENDDHYGIRTGMSITDVDYIVVNKYDKRIGYELAMNGTFIPVIDKRTEEVIFGKEDYDMIREQMQGLSYFDTKNFEVAQSAYNDKIEEKVSELFPDGNAQESIGEIDAGMKREAIERKVRGAILDKLGLGFETTITGDVTPGFIEFIDTGSTGRGTNLPGDGDFDFSLKLDKDLLENPKRLEEFKNTLREVVGVKSDDKDCQLTEYNGNFRYKKVQIDDVDMPLDIDISFMQKSEAIQYSTDMAVKDRLNGIKGNDPEGYKRVIANIVLAKEMLKQEGIYKKHSSDGATINGGFGGVGVENWILQNGGSFVNAMKTFLEASEKAESFSDFQEIYPIFDFGQNHMAKGYQHDSFIRGISNSGYTKMQETFKRFIKELEKDSIKQQQQTISIAQLGKNAINQGIRISEFSDADKSMTQEELQIESDKNLIGE